MKTIWMVGENAVVRLVGPAWAILKERDRLEGIGFKQVLREQYRHAKKALARGKALP